MRLGVEEDEHSRSGGTVQQETVEKLSKDGDGGRETFLAVRQAPCFQQLKVKALQSPEDPPSSRSHQCLRFGRSLECVSHPHSREFGLFCLAKLRRRGHSFVVCKYTRGMNARVGEELSKLKDPVGMRTNEGSVAV